MILALGGTAWHNFNTHQTMLHQLADQNGRILGSTIHQSIIAGMTNGQHREVAQVLQRISREPAIESLWIFDESGRILVSANPEESGDVVPAADLQAYRSGNFSYTDRHQKNEVHSTLVPILNAPACYRCHGQQARTLGILSVHLSLADMALLENQGSYATLTSSMGAMLIILLTIATFFLLYVDQPLRRTVAAMNSLEKGDLAKALTDIRSSGERRTLSNKFDLLLTHLRSLVEQTILQEQVRASADEQLAHQEEIRNLNLTLEERLKEIEYLNVTLEERIEEIEEANYKIADLAGELEDRNSNLERAVSRLQVLYSMGLTINSNMDLDQLFDQLIQRAMDTLGARVGYILLLDRESWTLNIGGARGIPNHLDRGLHIPLQPGGISQWVIKNRQPLLVADMENSAEFNQSSHLGFTRETVICAPLTIQDEIIGTLTMANRSNVVPFNHEDLKLLATIAVQASIAIKNARLYEAQQETYLNTVQALVSAVEASDPYTRGHSERVKSYALRLAGYLDLPTESIKRLEQAAILHDIGKIGICEALLHKQGTLTAEELKTLREHPDIGVKILEPIRFLEGVRKIIQQHHEWFDGSGYPNGRNGEEVSIEARILAVADAFDAMTTDRPYRKALPRLAAIQEIRENSGGQFDPDVASAFLNMLREDAPR